MEYSESLENYLKAIVTLQETMPEIRQVDLAEYMGYSKPSICKAVRLLEREGLLELRNHRIFLTEAGERRGREVRRKHEFFTRLLVRCGVERGKAAAEACGMEHVISDESFGYLEKALA